MAYRSQARAWQSDDEYDNPGPMQFRGPTCDTAPVTITLDRSDYMHRLTDLSARLASIHKLCRPGVSEDVLETALVTLKSLHKTLELLRRKE
jgi:hypothetical protein